MLHHILAKCWYIVVTIFKNSGLCHMHWRESNSNWKLKCSRLWVTIMTLHSTSRKAYNAWHLKQKNVSESNAYLSTSNIFLLISLIQISVESPSFITMFTRDRQLSLFWARSIQSMSHPTSKRSVLMLSFHLCLGLPSCLFASRLPTTTLNVPLLSPICVTCPVYLILIDLHAASLPYLLRDQTISFFMIYNTVCTPPLPPYVLDASPIPFFLILSPEKHLESSTFH